MTANENLLSHNHTISLQIVVENGKTVTINKF